jgi:hypothetical protein
MKSDKRKRARRKVPPVVRPSTPREWALCRVGLSCKIGRDALAGKGVPATCSAVEYALFNLLHAVEDIAAAMGPNNRL